MNAQHGHRARVLQRERLCSERGRPRAEAFARTTLRDSAERAPTKTLASGARGHYVGGVQLQLLAFAQAADRLGFRERTIACEPTESPRALLARIAPAFPTENLRAAVDREYRSWDAPLGEARELALIPPVSGG